MGRETGGGARRDTARGPRREMTGGYPQEPGKARLFERYVHLLQRYISRKISFGVSGCINLEIRISVWKASLAARGSPSN